MKETWDQLIDRQLSEATAFQKAHEKETIDLFKKQEREIRNAGATNSVLKAKFDKELEDLKNMQKAIIDKVCQRQDYEREVFNKFSMKKYYPEFLRERNEDADKKQLDEKGQELNHYEEMDKG